MRNRNKTVTYYFSKFPAAKIRYEKPQKNCYYRRKRMYFTGEIYAKFIQTIVEEKTAKNL
jgi:hypothetical protein